MDEEMRREIFNPGGVSDNYQLSTDSDYPNEEVPGPSDQNSKEEGCGCSC